MSAVSHNCHSLQIFKDAIDYAMFAKVKTAKLVQRSAQLFGATHGSFDTFLMSSFFRALFLTLFGRAFTCAKPEPVNLSTNKSFLPEGLLKRMQLALAEILVQTIGYSHNLVEQFSIHGYLDRLQER
jgi:hypothetical protein